MGLNLVRCTPQMADEVEVAVAVYDADDHVREGDE